MQPRTNLPTTLRFEHPIFVWECLFTSVPTSRVPWFQVCMGFPCKHYKARVFLWEFENEGVMILALSNKYSNIDSFWWTIVGSCQPAKTHMLQKVAQLIWQKAFPVKGIRPSALIFHEWNKNCFLFISIINNRIQFQWKIIRGMKRGSFLQKSTLCLIIIWKSRNKLHNLFISH